MAEEYYIRSADSDTARGPFSIDKLASLAEADQVDNETLFYMEDTAEWLAIGANDELRRQVFPEKKKLGLKAKTDEDMDLLNAEEDEIPAITVDEMLAAAEGDTDETRHVKDKVRLQEKAAAMSIPAIGLIMLVSAFNNVFPNFEVITRVINDEDYLALLQHPSASRRAIRSGHGRISLSFRVGDFPNVAISSRHRHGLFRVLSLGSILFR